MDNFKKIEDLKKQNELLEKLKDIQPTLFKDGILDFDQLKLELGLVDQNLEETNEKYGLNWVGKKKAYFETTKTSTMTLVPQRDKSMNFDESDNIIIEGDNLEVLRLLEKSYFNKVDVIYIDPPYNTGNDFVYNDDFKQDKDEFEKQNNIKNEEGHKTETKNTRSDGRFHTNWLNMMYPRLRLARNLLKEDGVIFISIDDNEQARLKLMCDEIFGELNFIGNWPRLKSTQGKNDSNYPVSKHDYLLIYSKDKFKTPWNQKETNTSYYNQDDNDGRGPYHTKNYISATEGLGYIKSLDFEIEINGKTYFPKSGNKRTRWLWSKERIKKAIDLNILVPRGEYVYQKKYKNFEFDENDEFVPKTSKTNFDSLNCIENNFSNKTGTKNLKEILNGNVFQFPKPVNLIKYVVNLINNKNSIILDFFAGSGTTAQAVMELNKEDGGNRKFILVQYPEKSENLENTEFETIADITRERIKRSIEIYDYKENGFKAFKLQDSNLKSFDANANDSVDAIQQKLFDIANKIKDGTTTEDLIYEIILRVGKLPLDIKIQSDTIANNKVYFDENKYFIFMLEPTIGSKYYENILDVIKQIYKDTPIHVFLNDSYFKNDQDKINFSESIKNIEKNDAKIEIMVI